MRHLTDEENALYDEFWEKVQKDPENREKYAEEYRKKVDALPITQFYKNSTIDW